MLTKIDIQTLINECRKMGSQGLGNGNRAIIQELTVDFLIPPTDFLGVGSNPAIFVNQDTYNLLGKYHSAWQVNKTIAVKERFLEKNPTMVIGIIIHEAGHAFNVAANITNSEANAYIFEIEVISLWFKTKNPLLVDCSRADLQAFFESRLSYYRIETKHCEYLAELVKAIEINKILDPSNMTINETKNLSGASRFVIPTPRLLDSNPRLFFTSVTSPLTATNHQTPLTGEDRSSWRGVCTPRA